MKIAAPKLPTPMYSRAVTPKSKADEKKFAEAITKVVDEDLTPRAVTNISRIPKPTMVESHTPEMF